MVPTNLNSCSIKNINPNVDLFDLVEEEGGDEADDRHAHVKAVEREPHTAGLQHEHYHE